MDGDVKDLLEDIRDALQQIALNLNHIATEGIFVTIDEDISEN